jgi:hypothetical protein
MVWPASEYKIKGRRPSPLQQKQLEWRMARGFIKSLKANAYYIHSRIANKLYADDLMSLFAYLDKLYALNDAKFIAAGGKIKKKGGETE